MNGDPSTVGGRRWAKVARLALVVGVLGVLAWAAAPHVGDVVDALTPALAGALVVAVALNVAANVLLADNWGRLLALLGAPLELDTARRVWGRGQLARFAFGSAQLLSRPALARAHGVPARVGVASTLLETVWMAAVTATASLAVAPAWLDAVVDPTALVVVAGLGVAALVVLTAAPAMALRPLLWGLERVGRPIALAHRSGEPRVSAVYVANAALRVAGFLLVVATLPGATAGGELAVAGAAAFLTGNLVGLLVVFAPGGLGPREAVSALLLADALDPAGIIVALAGVRLVELAAEGLFLLRWGRSGTGGE